MNGTNGMTITSIINNTKHAMILNINVIIHNRNNNYVIILIPVTLPLLLLLPLLFVA